jgi:pimeloyl-ACP methyl ester carboxylesterase
MYIRQKINLNKIQLSYLEWKQGSQPLLMLHGLADHGLVWSSLGDYLAPNYHIIAPDLRGHGDSSKPENGYFFNDYIADLEALFKELNWQKAHVISHSWSAKLACIWATKSPQYFHSLTLIDPFFISSMPSIFEITFPILYKVLPFLKMLGPFSSYEAAEIQAKKLKQYQGWTPFQQKVFKASIEQKKDGTWGSKFVKQARNEIFLDVMRVSGLTKNIDIPSLLIIPEKGLNRTEWQIQSCKTYLKKLQIAKVKGNHWAFLVEPDNVNLTIKNYLSNLTLNK